MLVMVFPLANCSMISSAIFSEYPDGLPGGLFVEFSPGFFTPVFIAVFFVVGLLFMIVNA